MNLLRLLWIFEDIALKFCKSASEVNIALYVGWSSSACKVPDKSISPYRIWKKLIPPELILTETCLRLPHKYDIKWSKKKKKKKKKDPLVGIPKRCMNNASFSDIICFKGVFINYYHQGGATDKWGGGS